MRLLVILIALSVVFTSCEKKNVSEEELIAYINDERNGLKKTAASGAINVSVTYRPTDLLVRQQSSRADTVGNNVLRKKFDAYYYLVLSLSHDQKEALHQSGSNYSDLVQTLSFRMSDYVTLTTSANDTIPVGDFILNRTYGMSNSTDLLFVFNKAKAANKEWIQFNLNEFGLGIGNQRFRFRRKDLENVPMLM